MLQLPLGVICWCVRGEIVICICFLFVLFCGVFGKKKECILMSVFGHMFSCGVSSDNWGPVKNRVLVYEHDLAGTC